VITFAYYKMLKIHLGKLLLALFFIFISIIGITFTVSFMKARLAVASLDHHPVVVHSLPRKERYYANDGTEPRR
jgi:hypothetical protein